MKYLKSVAAWCISGGGFGLLLALAITTVGCAPRLQLKPALLLLWMILFAVEYAVIGLVVGTVVFFVFGRTFPSILGFRRALGLGCVTAVLLVCVSVIALALSPASASCAVP